MSSMTPDEWSRYSRHLALREVGAEGQERLRRGNVLVVGAGGLGSPVALYLAAAGVGRIGIVDHDLVEESNLQRQILHGTAAIGKPKLSSAVDRLRDLNPFVELVPIDARLDSSNAMNILEGWDIIVDGTDNFPTRYLINDACVFLGKPNIYGSIFRFEGQASVFHPASGAPCYRCLYPEPPPPDLVPSCEEGGVLGIVPGLVGSVQASEALKLLLGQGRTLAGRLLLIDVLRMEFREMKLRRDPLCRVCGESPSVTTLIDYEGFCGLGRMREDEMTPRELKRRLDSGENPALIDVREGWEWEISRLEGAKHVPLGRLREEMGEIPRERDVVVYCRTGARSARACAVLREAGFRAANLSGGLAGWAREVDPTIRVG
ncbi:MAG: molybdopterin-synthase adenylyltransferase MoeB [Thermoanaerobaculia bacterium]